MQDLAVLLTDVVSELDFVPSEIQHFFQELKELDNTFDRLTNEIAKLERNWLSILKISDNVAKRSEEETKLVKRLIKDYSEAEKISDKKIDLASKALLAVERHLKKLNSELRQIDKDDLGFLSKAESSIDPGSLFTTPSTIYGRKAPSTVAGGLNQIPKLDKSSIPGGISLTVDNKGLEKAERKTAFLAAPRQTSSGANLSKNLDSLLPSNRIPKRGNESQPPSQSNRKHKKQTGIPRPGSFTNIVDSDNGIEESDDQLYCFCRQVSFGDMVACDSENCKYEWFHYECVGLKSPPVGSWYCSSCRANL